MTNHTDTEKKKGSFLKELLQWAAAIALAAAVAIIADNFLIVNAQIPSGSMEDTIMPGDRIIGNRLSYTFSDPQRFDVIIFRYPDDESQLFIKRIIGLPGETVQIIEGTIYIDGEPLTAEEESLCSASMAGLAEYPVELGEDEYFLLGDNRESSEDSRFESIGNVSRSQMAGKVWLRIAPASGFGWVR